MNRLSRLGLGLTVVVSGGLCFGLLGQSAGWQNLRLRVGALAQHIGGPAPELDELQAQGIDLARSTRIDLDELLSGGPPKDGIPSIDSPQFDSAETTPYGDDAVIIGVVINGDAVAYPIGILNWHEIVNDTVGGQNISVTYCPLCDTALVVDRGNRTFGVSGQLYQSCLVMYDRADDTLYAQPWALGIVGPQVNRFLVPIPTAKTTLGRWLAQHPNSKILSTDTGHSRNYTDYPYGTYNTDEAIYFPVRNQANRELHPKAPISYLWQADGGTPFNTFSGEHLAVSHAAVEQVGVILVDFAGQQVRIYWDAALQTVQAETVNGDPVTTSPAFAFVYPAFFNDSLL
ncbi:MAG: DUF3179 domain-containing protein [Cyanobacteria bacterium P01_D01_bin.14]